MHGIANVLSYGAVANDPAKPCDDAIDRVRASGLIVYFPSIGTEPTTYYLARQHELRPYERWHGDHYVASRLRAARQSTEPLIVARERFCIERLGIQGLVNGGNYNGSLIAIDNPLKSGDWVIRDVMLVQAKVGIDVRESYVGLMDNVHILTSTDCGLLISGPTANAITFRSGQVADCRDGIVIRGSGTKLSIVDSTLQGFTHRGVSVESPLVFGVSITGNYFEANSAGAGIDISGLAVATEIRGNTFSMNAGSERPCIDIRKGNGTDVGINFYSTLGTTDVRIRAAAQRTSVVRSVRASGNPALIIDEATDTIIDRP